MTFSACWLGKCRTNTNVSSHLPHAPLLPTSVRCTFGTIGYWQLASPLCLKSNYSEVCFSCWMSLVKSLAGAVWQYPAIFPWAQPIPFLDHHWQTELFFLSSGPSSGCPSCILGTGFSCPHPAVLPGALTLSAGPQRPSRPFCSVVTCLCVCFFVFFLNHEIGWNLS